MKTSILEAAIDKGYYVDEDGNAFGPTGILRPGVHRGYRHFSASLDRRRSVKVAQLQAIQKFGAKAFSEAEVTRHLDDNKLNDSWDNIEIGTHKQNMNDVAVPFAARPYPALVNTLTGERIPAGVNLADVVRKYGLDQGGMSKVVNGRRRSHKGWQIYD